MSCPYRNSRTRENGDAGSSRQPRGGFGRKLHDKLQALHRDPEYGKIAGVCAGLAHTFGLRPITIRVAAVIFLFMNPPAAVVLYGLGVLLLKRKQDMPVATAETPRAEPPKAAEPAAQDEGLPESLKFEALRKKFRDLERRAADLERTVTSEDYDLKRQFREI